MKRILILLWCHFISAFDGIVNGAVLTADRFGNSDSVYDFNGNNSHIMLNNNVAVITNTTFSIVAWARVD